MKARSKDTYSVQSASDGTPYVEYHRHQCLEWKVIVSPGKRKMRILGFSAVADGTVLHDALANAVAGVAPGTQVALSAAIKALVVKMAQRKYPDAPVPSELAEYAKEDTEDTDTADAADVSDLD